MKGVPYFNSTMVRLKDRYCIWRQHQALFQFHYGTIKRSRDIEWSYSNYLFQFHYGTIKRVRNITEKVCFFYFNSTMVRLKVSSSCALYTWIPEFQFHYGTIKSPNRRNSFEFVILFQFHYGTIKSCSHYKSNLYPLPFQFHYGTIKSWYAKFCCMLHRNFNSTMVRLKARTETRKGSDTPISIPLWYD